MVDIVDATDQIVNLTELENDLQAATLARSTPNDKSKGKSITDNTSDNDDDIPDKYRGKSLKEIIAMHQNAESSLGRMANDLGTQRKLTDRILDLKRETDLGNNTAPAKVQIKSDELLENPTEALDRYTAPREQANQQRIDHLERQMALQAFVAKHPDYAQFSNDAEFANWVNSSPIRARAAATAARGDWTSADDLLTEYKGEKARTKKADVVEDEAAGEDTPSNDKLAGARKASFESSSQASAGAKKGGKVYSRAALMRLRVEKPDTYYNDDFQTEILAAYNEGRVK
jgi:hypothetical protein